MSVISQTLETLVPGQEPTATDFYKTHFQGYIRKIIAIFSGRSNHLQDVETLSAGAQAIASRYRGTHTVRIDQIKGSEGRCSDFDQEFHPLKLHNRDRWLSIALAWYKGISLPAVELIKIRDTYIVRDGHHRISVAKYMGADFIDARVCEIVH
jgi:hypothetical protein